MNDKTAVEDKTITDEELELHQNTDPVSDPADAVTTGVDPKEPVQAPEATGALSVPLEEYERMKAERDQVFDRMARLQAEFDNARKREARERAEFRDFATAGAVEQFLPVIDNFQLALKAGGTAEQLRGGVELIVKQMDDVLRSLNVQPVETVGAQFDPHVHESIDSVERVDLPDQQVLEEVRRGYRMKERLLRPALVRVVSNRGSASA
ncbi:Heat shock protein GrpE [Acidisarcina polymorpha]|uniref:Protein GrpE n=1 Tax=Acidisarcina polymorpha TaxID=2211140 RepID=A0A2Z5FWG8_9BACT|nr:nucleotide exchange factor GrpE [Acidisarcina polymorpha]AXC11070.1 Heat shock protein GrpE [Acidisarcina polymorpha]